MFPPSDVFEVLYQDAVSQLSEGMTGVGVNSDVVRSGWSGWSGFVGSLERHLGECFERLVKESVSASDVHRRNLRRFKDDWRYIISTSTCLCCLRRRPQYALACGHVVCENCVLVFGDCCQDDPWIFKVTQCFLCSATMPQVILVKVNPPTAGVGVLCIDGGGTRGVVPLMLLKRIQDRLGFSIPIQRLFKLAFGISSGKSFPCLRGDPDEFRGIDSVSLVRNWFLR